MTSIERHDLISQIATLLTNKMTFSEIRDLLRSYNLEEDDISVTFGKKKYVQRMLQNCNEQLIIDIANQLTIDLPESLILERDSVTTEQMSAVNNFVQAEKEPTMSNPSIDTRKIFVVHGRNLKARDAMFDFLRSLDLSPIEFDQARSMTGKPQPYIGEILDAAFDNAQAVVVLLTGDDEAVLREEFRTPHDAVYETNLTPQPRQNVIFEAGMAFGRAPKRTVLLYIGNRVRPFSDIEGLHIPRFNGSAEDRHELVNRLNNAGCVTNTTGRDWLSKGDFQLPTPSPVPADFNSPSPQQTNPSDADLGNWWESIENAFKKN